MPASSPGSRVLIVDDDATLLDALSDALLLRLGAIKIDTCLDAKSALQRVGETDYDAVITDIKMPGIDGLAFVRRLRELLPQVPALVITGHAQLDLAMEAIRSGVFDLIQKPLDRDHLMAAVSRAIETRRLRREVKEQQEALRAYATQLEQRVEERTAELTRALRIKDEFLAIVAHELRTPVTIIVGNIELMAKRGDTLGEDDKAASVMDLRREARRLLRLVENALVLARIEYGRRSEPLPVSLGVAITQEVEWHAQMHRERPMEVRLPENLRPVLCDELSVELVLANLLANAQKYSPPDQPIEIRAHVNGSTAVVSVCDRGSGVSPEEAERIFDPFYRAEKFDGVQGTGIGLAVCKRLVEAYGGRVWLSPRDGGGTEFSFSLPLALEPTDVSFDQKRIINEFSVSTGPG